MKNNDNWIQQDKGWWTKENVGGICREIKGWYFHPIEGKIIGPFRTLEETKNKVPSFNESTFLTQ